MLYQTENPHGGDLYGGEIRLDFSANVNPLGTPPGVLEAVRKALPLLPCYPDPYCRDLVRAIGAHEKVTEDVILCGNGAAELIYAFGQAVKPKTVMELAPTFSEYSEALEDSEILRFPLGWEGAFSLNEGFLRAVEEAAPEVVFLCNPNNPTGRLIPENLLRKILSLCQKKNIRVFLDECFLDLSEGHRNRSDLIREFENLVILKAFTKTYAMAGLRLGYCLSSDRQLLGAMSRRMQPWNVSVPAQQAGVAALQENVYLEAARACIRRERQWLRDALEGLHLRVCPSEANYLLFFGPEGLEERLRRMGIAIRNCANYHGLGPGWYRIAVRLRKENEALLAALQQCSQEEPWPKI